MIECLVAFLLVLGSYVAFILLSPARECYYCGSREVCGWDDNNKRVCCDCLDN